MRDAIPLAREAHASVAHFSRSFKSAFGETPHQYLLRRRIERATDLLRSTGLSGTEVSVGVGFLSLGSFSTAFRDLVGEAPSEYARRWRASNARRFPRASRSCTRALWHRAVFKKPAPAARTSLPPASDEGGSKR